MTILFVSDHYLPAINGVAVHLRTLKKEMERLGHRVIILTSHYSDTKDTHEPDVIRIPTIAVPGRPIDRLSFPYHPVIEGQLASLPINIIHNHLFTTGFIGMRLAKKKHLPQVVTMHITNQEYISWILGRQIATVFKPATDLLTRVYYNRHTAAVAPSTKAQRALEEARVAIPIHKIYNGIYLDTFKQAAPDTFRQKFAIAPKRKLVTLVSRVDAGKNIDIALSALAIVKDKVPQVQLAIIGDGLLYHKIEQQIKEQKLEDWVIMAGFLDKDMIASAHKAAEFSLTTSDSDILPTIAIEAIASGLPMVAVNDLAIIDIVHNNINGILVEKLPQAVAEGMLTLLSSPDLTKQYGQASLRISEQFSAESNAKNLLGLYQSLLVKNQEGV